VILLNAAEVHSERRAAYLNRHSGYVRTLLEHTRAVSRVELGLLGLWLARERAWGRAMRDGMIAPP
jgi:hypothetical protein